MVRSPLIGINRHRIGIDGQGVTTLVGFHGCPLHCPYCLNPQCKRADGIKSYMTPKELIEAVSQDELYFLATGGGITFGGGEPLLHADFIASFCRQMPSGWRITIETCLAVPEKMLELVLPVVDEYLIDVKDMNAVTYQAYTKCDNILLKNNLQRLIEEGKQDCCILRIPHIPGFNTTDDVAQSRLTLEKMGFSRFDTFDYMTDIPQDKQQIE